MRKGNCLGLGKLDHRVPPFRGRGGKNGGEAAVFPPRPSFFMISGGRACRDPRTAKQL
jgi:hypothetical protein